MIQEDRNDIFVSSTNVKCGGDADNSDHPAIYLKINRHKSLSSSVTCPYCSKRYILRETR